MFCIRGLLFLALILAPPFAHADIPDHLTGIDLVSGKSLDLPLHASGKKGSVVVFLSAKCPCSNSHIPILQELQNKYKDFRFVGIHSNNDEDGELSRKYFQSAHLNFPMIEDAHGKIADAFKALKTPHAYIVDNDKKILYRGGVTSSAEAARADKNFLAEALADISAGRSVRQTEARTLGCIIARGN